VFKEKQKLIPIVIGSTVTIILFVIITLLSFAPIQLSGSFGPISVDKAYHFVAYFCLVFTLPLLRPSLTIWVALGVMVYSGLIELVQYLFGREPSWGDFIANGIGVIVGAAIARQMGLWICGLGETKSVNNEPMNDA
jgi:VanZ family protein